MLDSNFLEILCPIRIEAQFLLPKRIESLHDALHTVLKSDLELLILFISCLDDGFVVFGVGDLNLMTNLVLFLIRDGRLVCWLRWDLSGFWSVSYSGEIYDESICSLPLKSL